MKDDSEFLKLEREVQLIEEWLNKNHVGSQHFPKYINKYKRWDNLSSSLIDFLRSKPLANWTASDAALCSKAVRFDFFELSLLNPLSFDDLVGIAVQTTVPIASGFQVYLSLVCGKIQDSKQQLELATKLFEGAQTFNVQLEALKVLAENDSAMTEQCARRMWNSGDSRDSSDWPEFAKQIAILTTLRTIKSQKLLLDEFIVTALESEYPAVVSLAKGLAFRRDFGYT
ncbi:MAG: hypothetical protein SFV17_20095 [Candidatus Obscuribacter sp.]|nr:hypothetical protein [Candidatus Obscuribacter sp.]